MTMASWRHSFLSLSAAVLALLAVLPAAAEPRETGRAAKPDRQQLVSTEKTLRRSDTHGAATAELRLARRWLLLAQWAGDEGATKQERRMVQLAKLQLDLARRLVSLSRLRAEINRLTRSIALTRKTIVEDRNRIKQRGEYLDVLRSTR